MVSRTPQNTPANNAPISSRAQAPDLSTLNEGELLAESVDTGLESRGIRRIQANAPALIRGPRPRRRSLHLRSEPSPGVDDAEQAFWLDWQVQRLR